MTIHFAWYWVPLLWLVLCALAGWFFIDRSESRGWDGLCDLLLAFAFWGGGVMGAVALVLGKLVL